MKTLSKILGGVVATSAIVPAAVVVAGGRSTQIPGLVQQVRDATRAFRDVNDAIVAGYTSLGACVSGPDQGAMEIPRRTSSGAWFWRGTSC